MKFIEKRFEVLLKEHGLIKDHQLDEAHDECRRQGKPLREILLEKRFVSPVSLAQMWADLLNCPAITLSKYKISPDVLSVVPEKISRRYNILPLALSGKLLTIAIESPLDIVAVDDIKIITNCELGIVVTTAEEMQKAQEHYYASDGVDFAEIIRSAEITDDLSDSGMQSDEEEIDVQKIAQESSEAPIVKLVNYILIDAVRKRASDIHIEPFRGHVNVRFRIDGALHQQARIPKQYQNAVLARIKIMSKMDITEFRIPQDGRFKIRFENRDIDFRVSVLPVSHGGKIVMRALDRGSLSLGLAKLGYLPKTLNRFSEALKAPFDMILITGPTGSGKSTTLYSILNELNLAERNIITVEDPVEYQLEGITQMQVIQESGFTFAEGLRSILRQSPDIIMVGEIRDSETADIAVKSALTGHLVFSTLHTNDAASAMTRLRDMNVEPFLLSSSIVMVVAQRLCRKNCPSCLEEYDVPESVFTRIGVDPKSFFKDGKRIPFFKGKGCEKCQGTGYYGRVAIAEVFLIDDTIKSMVMDGASSDKMKKYAMTKGMLTLRQEALERFKMGETTLEEILRVTSEET